MSGFDPYATVAIVRSRGHEKYSQGGEVGAFN